MSRSTITIAVSGVLAVAGIIGYSLFEEFVFSPPPLVGVFISFCLFVGLGFVLPQLYLASGTTDPVRRRARIRFAVTSIGVFALLAWRTTAESKTQQYLFLAAGAVALLGLLGYELLSGYRTGTSGASG